MKRKQIASTLSAFCLIAIAHAEDYYARISVASQFTIDVPQHWDTTVSTDSKLQFRDSATGVFIHIVKSFEEAPTQPTYDSPSLLRYMEDRLLSRQNTYTERPRVTQDLISGIPTHIVETVDNQEAGRIYTYGAIFITSNYKFNIYLNCRARDANEWKAIFHHIVHSITVIPQEPVIRTPAEPEIRSAVPVIKDANTI
jgi:hypothetical protein